MISSEKLNSDRILFVAPSAYPLGGVQTWLDYLLPGLKKHGYESTIALTSGDYHNASKYLQVHAFDKVKILCADSNTSQSRIEAIETLISEVKPALIVVVNIADVYQAVNNLRKQCKTEIRVVTSIHGIDLPFFAEIRDNNQIIDAVISTNKLTQRLIDDSSGLPKSRSLYAPYGVLPPNQTTDPKKKNASITIAYAGRFDEEQKRFSDALAIFTKALEQISTLKIILAGSGSSLSDFHNWLERNQQFSNRVNYLGVLRPEEMQEKLYQKADILLLTSQWETGPIVAWEAMSHGVCFISSRYHGHQEEQSLIDLKNCLLFDIGDIDGAVNCIHRANDHALQRKITRHAFTLVEEKYTEEKSIQSWADCFAQILNVPERSYSRSAVRANDRGRMNSIMFYLLRSNGLRLAERLRRLLNINRRHTSAGSEWPHSYQNQYSKSIGDYINLHSEPKD